MLLAERYCNAGLFVVIEDDMRRRGDPRIPDFAGFAGDGVVWHDAITSERTERAAELLGDGAAGYPTNACVAGFFPAQSELEPADLARIAESAVALIASVYDAESFVVLEETSGTASTIAVAADER